MRNQLDDKSTIAWAALHLQELSRYHRVSARFGPYTRSDGVCRLAYRRCNKRLAAYPSTSVYGSTNPFVLATQAPEQQGERMQDKS